MGKDFTEKQIRDLYVEYLDTNETEEKFRLKDAKESRAERLSFNMDFEGIERFREDLADDFLSDANLHMEKIESVMQDFLCTERRIYINVYNFPDTIKVPIRDIREKHIAKVVSVEGMVKKITEVKNLMTYGVFKCARCPAEIPEKQDKLIYHEPIECYKEHRGCGRTLESTKFTLIPEHSIYEDVQKLEIQDSPEGLRGGQTPSSMVCYITGPLCGKINPGDRVTISGIIEIDRHTTKVKNTILERRLWAISYKMNEKDYDNLEITPEEKERIEALSKDEEIYEKMIESVCPTIKGYDELKEISLLQLFGGTTKYLPDGTRLRGDIHVLWAGDPGISKSVYLRYVTDLAPRGVYTSGKGSSAAGLTAAAVQDKDFNADGKWTLEAGALVLADNGLVAVDELDKMSPTDRGSLHVPLEAQVLEVHKAGIHAKLPCRCAVMGAMNPKYGKFDKNEPFVPQLDLDTALMSRFDVIYITTDDVDSKRDREIARHILRNHRLGQEIASKGTMSASTVKLDSDFIRKYVSVGRQVIPIMNDEVATFLENAYDAIRKGSATNGISITARQLEAMIRLSEASARVRLSKEVTIDDAKRAVRLVMNALTKLCPDGNITPVMAGIRMNKQQKMKIVRDIMSERIDETIKKAELIDLLKERGMMAAEAEEVIGLLRDKGEITVPKLGYVKLIRE